MVSLGSDWECMGVVSNFTMGVFWWCNRFLRWFVRSWIGKLRPSSSPKSVPWRNSIEHRHSLKRSLRINSCRRRIGKPEDFEEEVDPVNQAELERISHSPFQLLYQTWVQAFGSTVNKRWLWLVNGCLQYHRPIITNAFPPKWSQKSLRLKPLPIPLTVCEVGNSSRFDQLSPLICKEEKKAAREL